MLVPDNDDDMSWFTHDTTSKPARYFYKRLVKGFDVELPCRMRSAQVKSLVESQLNVTLQPFKSPLFHDDSEHWYFYYARLSPCVQVFVGKTFKTPVEDQVDCERFRAKWRVYVAFDMNRLWAQAIRGLGEYNLEFFKEVGMMK